MTALHQNARAGRVAVETAVAAAASIAVGVLAAWLVYLALTPRQLATFGPAPFILSLVAFGAFALFRLPRIEASIPAIAIATLCGLIGVVVGAAVLILMAGCRFGDCINL